MAFRRQPLVIALAMGVLVGACGGITSTATSGPTLPADSPLASGLPSIPPSSAAPESAEPSPEPSTPSPNPSPAGVSFLAPGTAVEVVAKELNLRKKPSTSAKRVSLLKRGDVVVISPLDNLNYGWGPIHANGFDWYPVIQVSTADGRLPHLPAHPVMPLDGAPVAGWVAAGEGSKAYIRALAPRCPAVVDLLDVAGLLPAERLACFGSNPIVLEGTYGCFGCGALVVGTFEPAWIATPVELDFLSIDPSVVFGPIALRFAPDGPDRPPVGSIIRVTVHLDDSRAATCSIVDGEGSGALVVAPVTAHAFCRERLVVDSYENLGPDPRFPTS
jgi:hypothetical protein